jgi:hypothetical protein
MRRQSDLDAGKQILHDEKRKERAADVSIQFIDGLFQHFNVIASEDEYDKKNPELLKRKKGEIKYMGILVSKEPHKNDLCTCESFYFGNSDEYKKANPAAFQCKHLHGARKIRYGDGTQ